jgi:hypothetical protein
LSAKLFLFRQISGATDNCASWGRCGRQIVIQDVAWDVALGDACSQACRRTFAARFAYVSTKSFEVRANVLVRVIHPFDFNRSNLRASLLLEHIDTVG